MAATIHAYGQFPMNLANKLLSDLEAVGTTLKVALCTDTYVPDQDADESFADITNEVIAASYTAGGNEITTKALTYAARVTTVDGDDVEWPAADFTCHYGIIYDATPALAANQKLIAWIDFDGDKVPAVQTFKIIWNASGILTFTVPA